MRWLIDVDVVLDVLADREPWFQHSARVLGHVEDGTAEGLIAAHTVTTLWYLLSTHRGPEVARDRVRTILKLFAVVPVDENRLERALDLPIRDYEDAVQAECARSGDADVLVSRNESDYADTRLEVLTPVDLLVRLEI